MAKSNGRETFRKVITSPELTVQINQKNMKLVERFLKNFATKRSPKSVTVYRLPPNTHDCNLFLQFGAEKAIF